jgi:hypothetical protein
MFLELGLPFILRFVNDWRAGKTTIKEAVETVKQVNVRKGEKTPPSPTSAEEAEKRFMDKVERELALPEYNLFSKSPNFKTLSRNREKVLRRRRLNKC